MQRKTQLNGAVRWSLKCSHEWIIDAHWENILTRRKASTCLSSPREPRVFGLPKLYWAYKSLEVLMRPFIHSAWSVHPLFTSPLPVSVRPVFPLPPPLQRRRKFSTPNPQLTLRLKQNFLAHNLSSLRHRVAIMWARIIHCCVSTFYASTKSGASFACSTVCVLDGGLRDNSFFNFWLTTLEKCGEMQGCTETTTGKWYAIVEYWQETSFPLWWHYFGQRMDIAK